MRWNPVKKNLSPNEREEDVWMVGGGERVDGARGNKSEFEEKIHWHRTLLYRDSSLAVRRIDGSL